MSHARLPRRFASATMTPLGIAFALTGAIAFAPPGAEADVPSPSTSTVPAVIAGRPSGAMSAPAIVVVRGFDGQLVPGATVEFGFAATGARLYATQNAGVTLDCNLRQLRAVTDGQGEVRIAPRFGGCTNSAPIEVRAEGVILGYSQGRSTDIDALGGRADLSDFNKLAIAYLPWAVSGVPPPACLDFAGNDCALCALALFAEDFLDPAPGTYCP